MTVQFARSSRRWSTAPHPEAAAPAHAWLEQHGRRFGLFIGGALDAGGDGETFDS